MTAEATRPSDAPRTMSQGAAAITARSTRPLPAPELEAYADDFVALVDALPTFRATIGCIVPAYNEEASIGAVLESLLAQSRLPDVIHVVVTNTSDRTFDVAAEYAGRHRQNIHGVEQFTEVFVHDIGRNPGEKVGALNYGYSLVEGFDYLLRVAGDTIADSRAVEFLEAEIVSDSRIGGISAITSIDDRDAKGVIAPFLIAGQRSQLAAFNMKHMLRGRNTAVLGGQYSIFATKALRHAMRANRQTMPWVTDSEIEDSLLSAQFRSAGYLTKISARARADGGRMAPLHPNLRWWENLGMATSALSRILFVVLLAGSLSIGAFVFSPLWLIPPVVAVLLNLRIALSMERRNARDVLFAVLLLPAEVYMWIRIGNFTRAWTKLPGRKRVDNGAARAKAERGSRHGYLAPLLVVLAACVAMVAIWMQLSPVVQSSILWVGWPVLGAIAVVQTLGMLGKLVRRQRGYRV